MCVYLTFLLKISNVKIGVGDIPSPFAKKSSWRYRRVLPPASPVCCLWNRLSHLVAPGWTKSAETCPTTLRSTVQKTRSLWNPSLHQLFIFTAGQLVAPPGTNAVKIEEMTVKPGGQLNKQDSRVCLTATLWSLEDARSPLTESTCLMIRAGVKRHFIMSRRSQSRIIKKMKLIPFLRIWHRFLRDLQLWWFWWWLMMMMIIIRTVIMMAALSMMKVRISIESCKSVCEPKRVLTNHVRGQRLIRPQFRAPVMQAF